MDKTSLVKIPFAIQESEKDTDEYPQSVTDMESIEISRVGGFV